MVQDTNPSRSTTTTTEIAGEDTGKHTGLKVMTRDVNSDHWKIEAMCQAATYQVHHCTVYS